MKKIENFTAIAPKLNSGALEYCLWTDNDGALYVQIIRNIIDTQSPGKHSDLLFRVSQYIDYEQIDNSQQMDGINPSTFNEEVSKENNNSGFVKAIIKHLIPKQ